jgi:hypothetical protein
MMVAAGCAAPSQYYPPTGLSQNLEVVGGGLTINWKAPTAGTVYLVEKTSGKIIETKSLDEGEVYEFEVSPDQPTVFDRAVGVSLNNARLVLLFKPASPKGRTQ